MKKLFPVILLCLLAFVWIGADASQDSEKEAPKIRPNDGYAWVAVQVDDMKAMATFLKEKLNFTGEQMGDYYLFQVDQDAFLVLVKKQVEGSKADGTMISFHVNDVDDYCKQVQANGLKALDYMKQGEEIEKPVWRDWGSKEFAVMGPEGVVFVFTRMG
jgi:predicted enzyme related to lactoylglutathione lyase